MADVDEYELARASAHPTKVESLDTDVALKRSGAVRGVITSSSSEGSSSPMRGVSRTKQTFNLTQGRGRATIRRSSITTPGPKTRAGRNDSGVSPITNKGRGVVRKGSQLSGQKSKTRMKTEAVPDQDAANRDDAMDTSHLRETDSISEANLSATLAIEEHEDAGRPGRPSWGTQGRQHPPQGLPPRCQWQPRHRHHLRKGVCPRWSAAAPAGQRNEHEHFYNYIQLLFIFVTNCMYQFSRGHNLRESLFS